MFKAVLVIACVLATACLPALAQQESGNGLRTRQESGNGLRTRLVSELSFDDNILRQQNNKIASRVLLVNPGVDYQLEQGGRVLALGYDYANYSFLDSRADDYDSHTLDLSLEQRLGRSHRITLTGGFLSSAEGRGVGFNEGANALALEAPTDFQTKALIGDYQLGAEDAPVRFVATFGSRSTSRDSPLIINDSRDYREDLWGGQILYRLGWRTDLVAEVRSRDISYDRTPVAEDGSELFLDSTETQKLLGIDLRATAKTTGKLRVGSTSREFRWKSVQWDGAPASEPATEIPVSAQALSAAPQDTGSDLFWEVTGIWAPRSYSTFTLQSSITTREAVAVGFFIRSQEHQLAWKHRWNGWLQSEIDVSYGTDDYIGSSRLDERRAVNLRLLYTHNETTSLGLGVRHQKLDSGFGNLGFDKWVYYLVFNWADRWAGQE